MFRHHKYKGSTQSIPAEQVQVGQTVVAVDGGTVRPRRGEWPRVTCRDDYESPGDGHVVEIQLSDHPGAFCLRAKEAVTVARKEEA